MEQNISAVSPLRRLEELPIELLVYIFSFLPTSRDIVRLRYVSRKIRSISETSTLWKNFLWPWYDSREERSVNEVLKACGTHIKRLTFPGVSRGMAPSTAIKLVQHCCNVTEITLGTCLLNGDEVQKVVEMKFLRKLEICQSKSVPIGQMFDLPCYFEPIIVACSKLEELVLKYEGSVSGIYDYLYKWINAGCKPPNLSVIYQISVDRVDIDIRRFVERWPQWNSQIPAGHTAHFKVFSFDSQNWWKSSIAIPDLQLEFGENATYPFIKPSNFGLFGFGKDLMLLTNSTINGKVIHQLKEPSLSLEKRSLITSHLCCNVSTLNFITDFDASCCGLLSGHLEQLSIACPNLERLNLNDNSHCLENLKGLRSIVNQCHNLQGLKLDKIHVTGVQNCTELWELLSEIKMLNHLTVEACTMEPFGKNDTCAQHSFLKLVQNFVYLKYLQLSYSARELLFSSCQHTSYEAYSQLLAHFPVLVYCHVNVHCHIHDCSVNGKSSNVADVITNCRRLKYLVYYDFIVCLSSFFTAAPNQYLQHLHIISRYSSNIGELFMDSVSMHGKLERVFLVVRCVAVSGITALLQNSPKLYICEIRFRQIVDEENVEVDLDLKLFEDTLKNKFSHRKLFNLNGFTLTRDRD